jgi:omega-amidase
MEITIALAQMDIALGNPDLNQETARAMAGQATAHGAHLLVLPELWPTGYDLEQFGSYATPLDQGHFAFMADLARSYHLYVAGTALEANPEGLPFNTAALYGPDGERVGSYRKVHLWAPMGEADYMSAGDSLPAFDTPWGRVALAICYDLRFPEVFRRYADAGAQLIVIPAEWPVRRVEHWRLLLRARAVENQLFVLGCNRAGVDVGAVETRFGGHSAIVDPWGNVLVEGEEDPGLFVATLELDKVTQARRLFPFLADRRPEVYESAQVRGNHV